MSNLTEQQKAQVIELAKDCERMAHCAADFSRNGPQCNADAAVEYAAEYSAEAFRIALQG